MDKITDECSIKKVIITVGEIEISLTLGQVHKLRDLLNSLIEKENVYIDRFKDLTPNKPFDPFPPPWKYPPIVTYTENNGEIRSQI